MARQYPQDYSQTRPSELGMNPLDPNPHLSRERPFGAPEGRRSGAVWPLVVAILAISGMLLLLGLLTPGDPANPPVAAGQQELQNNPAPAIPRG